MVQRKLLKSSLVRMPVPKKRTMGMMATTPMSPKTCCSWCDMHHRMIVTRVTMLMNHCVPENLSFMGRIGTMVVPLPGWKVTRSKTQMRNIDMMQIGSAMKNHTPHEGCGRIFWRAMIFWGEAMGEAAPPMFEASAMPRIKALENSESDGRLRRSGYTVPVTEGTPGLYLGTHLNNRKAENRRCDIADPHAEYHCNEHVSDENCTRSCTRFA